MNSENYTPILHCYCYSKLGMQTVQVFFVLADKGNLYAAQGLDSNAT